jgi:pyridoxine 4-dehydrogenase
MTMNNMKIEKTFNMGGDLTINRLGFGAMRITGKGVWGQPENKSEALKVLKRAVELGVNFIDTADSYGPHVSEELIAEALYPYPKDLVIGTKGGLLRSGPNEWSLDASPAHLKKVVLKD